MSTELLTLRGSGCKSYLHSNIKFGYDAILKVYFKIKLFKLFPVNVDAICVTTHIYDYFNLLFLLLQSSL